MKTRLVVVQGAPATGKTTLASRLSKDLGVVLISKDHIKEALYDSLGYPTSIEESRLYGRAAIRSMYVIAGEYLKAGYLTMIEAPLEARFATQDLAALTTQEAILQIHVYCDPEVMEQRFKARVQNGQRHPGHLDNRPIDGKERQKENEALPGIKTIEFDTTNFHEDDYERLKERIKKELA